MIEQFTRRIIDELQKGGHLWLFLDYDGTLADFAPTPEDVLPDPELIELIRDLAQHKNIRVTILSGRRLSHILTLMPINTIILAGTYGIELQTSEKERVDRLTYSDVRPFLERLKPRWRALIKEKEDFFLEDKGWSLALHAKYASDLEAEIVLLRAREEIENLNPPEDFRVLGGHKFLEIGPKLAHKGKTVSYLLDRFPWPDALLVFIGDDDKDEEAFDVIQAEGGTAIVVSATPKPSVADYRLESPQHVRQWLEKLLLNIS